VTVDDDFETVRSVRLHADRQSLLSVGAEPDERRKYPTDLGVRSESCSRVCALPAPYRVKVDDEARPRPVHVISQRDVLFQVRRCGITEVVVYRRPPRLCAAHGDVQSRAARGRRTGDQYPEA